MGKWGGVIGLPQVGSGIFQNEFFFLVRFMFATVLWPGLLGLKAYQHRVLMDGTLCKMLRFPRDSGGIRFYRVADFQVDHRMKTVDEHIWAVGEIASYNGGMCYQLSAPGTLVEKHQKQQQGC